MDQELASFLEAADFLALDRNRVASLARTLRFAPGDRVFPSDKLNRLRLLDNAEQRYRDLLALVLTSTSRAF